MNVVIGRNGDGSIFIDGLTDEEFKNIWKFLQKHINLNDKSHYDADDLSDAMFDTYLDIK